MAKVSVPVEVSKEAYELGQSLVQVVKAVKQALADGWQPGQDVPTIIMSAIAALPAGIEGLDKLPEESKELDAFISAFLLAGKDVASVFLKKE